MDATPEQLRSALIAALSGDDDGISTPMQSRMWALGYLRGRITGYHRGNLSLATVSSAVRVAREYKADDADILALLHAGGLVFDANTETLTDSLQPPLRQPRSRRTRR